ncbi:MAG: LysM peptidoglycan-binding domain-containing protein [Flavobacteriaceae bacterium]
MNSRTKNVIALMLAVFMACALYSQQFTTHTVRQGETLFAIAQQYKVTPFNILKYNKELKQDEPLQPNTLLIIPLDASASDTTREVPTDITNILQEKDSLEVEPEPISFRTHKVRKRETIYGIAQRYDITEAQLKRYNSKLYASALKKGMRLRIPQFPVIVVDENAPDPDNYEMYTVQPKETRWSISHKYGITLDSLMVLNPELPKTTSHLVIGQQLLLPKLAGSSIEEQETQLFISYIVPAKKTLYSLGQEYGIDPQEIVRLNPEIVEKGGLKEGMKIRLPEKKIDVGEVNTANFVFYEVKPKQTVYSLTRKLELGYEELLELNPDLSKGLQAGMVLKLPLEKANELNVKNSLVLDQFDLKDSIQISNKPKLLFLLPFRTDRLNLNDLESASNSLARSNALKYSLGIYSGSLIALDSISDLGVSVDVKTYDTELSLERTKAILKLEDLKEYNAIIGPLQLNSLKEVAVQAYNSGVAVIAPLAGQGDANLDNVFYSVPPDSLLRRSMLRYMKEQVTDQNIIVIADAESKDAITAIKEAFPLASTVDILKEEKNISINIDLYSALLSEEKENWVFVETDNFKMISSVSSILNSSNSDSTRVRMFTTLKGKAFDNDVISGNHLSNLNFTYPSVYREVNGNAFRRRYRRRFGGDPDRYAIRGFDLTYDLLLKLAYKMDLFQVSETIGNTEYTGNSFDYAKELSTSYYNTASYIMMYENMQIKEVKSYP